MFRSASSSVGKRNGYSASVNREGMTLALASRRASAISPKTSRAAKPGSMHADGRDSTRPSVFANSRLETGFGETTFTGPCSDSFSMAYSMIAVMSSSAIQLMYCRPLPIFPPSPPPFVVRRSKLKSLDHPVVLKIENVEYKTQEQIVEKKSTIDGAK